MNAKKYVKAYAENIILMTKNECIRKIYYNVIKYYRDIYITITFTSHVIIINNRLFTTT